MDSAIDAVVDWVGRAVDLVVDLVGRAGRRMTRGAVAGIGTTTTAAVDEAEILDRVEVDLVGRGVQQALEISHRLLRRAISIPIHRVPRRPLRPMDWYRWKVRRRADRVNRNRKQDPAARDLARVQPLRVGLVPVARAVPTLARRMG